jgi:hypothetical protein
MQKAEITWGEVNCEVRELLGEGRGCGGGWDADKLEDEESLRTLHPGLHHASTA